MGSLPFIVFLASLGIAMVLYVRRALAEASQAPDARVPGRRLFRRGVFGIAMAFAAGWLLPVPDSIGGLVALRSVLLLTCLVSTTWLLAGIGILEAAARRSEDAGSDAN